MASLPGTALNLGQSTSDFPLQLSQISLCHATVSSLQWPRATPRGYLSTLRLWVSINTSTWELGRPHTSPLDTSMTSQGPPLQVWLPLGRSRPKSRGRLSSRLSFRLSRRLVSTLTAHMTDVIPRRAPHRSTISPRSSSSSMPQAATGRIGPATRLALARVAAKASRRLGSAQLTACSPS